MDATLLLTGKVAVLDKNIDEALTDEDECDHEHMECGCSCDECGDIAFGTYYRKGDEKLVPLCEECKIEGGYAHDGYAEDTDE